MSTPYPAPPPPCLPCPCCGERMQPGFTFCRPCWHELPFSHRVEIWTASSRAHFKQTFPDGPHRLEASMKAAVGHLRQHGSALFA